MSMYRTRNPVQNISGRRLGSVLQSFVARQKANHDERAAGCHAMCRFGVIVRAPTVSKGSRGVARVRKVVARGRAGYGRGRAGDVRNPLFCLFCAVFALLFIFFSENIFAPGAKFPEVAWGLVKMKFPKGVVARGRAGSRGCGRPLQYCTKTGQESQNFDIRMHNYARGWSLRQHIGLK